MITTEQLQAPRSLTIPELWVCWDMVIDQPLLEVKIAGGTLGKDSLPIEALNDVRTPFDRKPSIYPIIRTDYDLQSNQRLIDCQNQRPLRLCAIRDIFLLPDEGVEWVGPDMRKGEVIEIWQSFKRTEWTGRSLDDKLPFAEVEKDKANEKYRKVENVNALRGYAIAWSHLLPHHMDAFPFGDANRIRLVEMECKILNNIMATILRLVRARGNTMRVAEKFHYLMIGWRSGMALVNIHFGMKVGSFQKALLRMDQLKSQIEVIRASRGENTLRTKFDWMFERMKEYCKDRDPEEDLLAFDPKSPKNVKAT